MKKILMCRPTHFQVSYDINPWMTSQQGKVNQEVALRQWESLFEALTKVATVYLIDQQSHVPDMVFTANAGIVIGDSAILSNFTNLERQPEEELFQDWFMSKGFSVVRQSNKYEGEGDHLVDRLGRHWVGSGFRTDPFFSEFLKQKINKEVNVLKLIDPRWYHLDTCFCPLPNGQLMWYPQAFSPESIDLILKSFTTHVIADEQSALKFACNCVAIDGTLFIPSGTNMATVLKEHGYIVKEFELGEFIKAGGAAKCLVLTL